MKISTSLVVAAASLSSTALAHSWVHCTDYRGDVAYYEPEHCFGHPRPMGGGLPAHQAFGVDIGFDEQRNEAAAMQCHAPRGELPGYPAARYRQGATIRLAWPSKNHVAAACTNPHIPDTSLELFIEPYANAGDPSKFQQVVEASFTQVPHKNGEIDFQGFQNCPAFCENMDKSLCTGTFVVPDVPDGVYTFQWRWVFNAGTDPYVTCFEAYIGQDVAPVEQPTPAPTAVGEVNPTPAPTEGNCVGLYAQCGGGHVADTCCTAPAQCFKQSEWYSQCLSACPQGWECQSDNGGGNTPAPVVDSTPSPTAETSPAPTPSPPMPSPTPAPTADDSDCAPACDAGAVVRGVLRSAAGKVASGNVANACACSLLCANVLEATAWVYKAALLKCECFTAHSGIQERSSGTKYAGMVLSPLSAPADQ